MRFRLDMRTAGIPGRSHVWNLQRSGRSRLPLDFAVRLELERGDRAAYVRARPDRDPPAIQIAKPSHDRQANAGALAAFRALAAEPAIEQRAAYSI